MVLKLLQLLIQVNYHKQSVQMVGCHGESVSPDGVGGYCRLTLPKPSVVSLFFTKLE